MTDFRDVHSKVCLPIPWEDKTTVLIPTIACCKVSCNLIVVALTTSAKYVELVDNPPTIFWEFGLYINCSPFLNLWKVENPMVELLAPMETLAEFESEKNSTEWEINFVFTKALASFPFPPVIETIGVSVKSNPLSRICISLRFPLTARNPVAPEPTGSSIFNKGGLIISKPFPAEVTSIFSTFPVWTKSFDL